MIEILYLGEGGMFFARGEVANVWGSCTSLHKDNNYKTLFIAKYRVKQILNGFHASHDVLYCKFFLSPCEEQGKHDAAHILLMGNASINGGKKNGIPIN